MVVDDMSVSRGLIENALDEIGLRHVDFKTDGASALRSLVGSPVHLVISDYNMPGMDGVESSGSLAPQQIHATDRLHPDHRPRGPGGSERGGNSWGMNNFLTKPFSTQGLKTCIEQVVGVLH